MDKLKFSDAAIYDDGMKTAISVRDGVLEYLGSEIGMELVFAKPGELQEMAELPFVIRVNLEGEFLGIVMRLP